MRTLISGGNFPPCLFAVSLAAVLLPASPSLGDEKPAAISAEDLRCLANAYAEIQECRKALAALEKIEKGSLEDFRKARIAEIDLLLAALELQREKKAASAEYLDATEQSFLREIQTLRKADARQLSTERREWLAARRTPLEERMAAARQRELRERKRLGLP
jgi:hypothetical protein